MAINIELISNTPPSDTLFEAADKINANFQVVKDALDGAGVGFNADDAKDAIAAAIAAGAPHTNITITYDEEAKTFTFEATGGGSFEGTMDDITDGSTYVKTHNDYTDDEASKLSGIASGAEVNVQADWNAVTGDGVIANKPTSMAPTSHGNTAHSSTFITASDLPAAPTLSSLGGEPTANKATTTTSDDDTHFPTTQAVNEAIAAAGAGIPVGGTTGQALVKKSNTNYDTEWDDVGGTGSFDGTMDDITDGSTYVKTHNDFTDAAESKLSGIADGAEVNVQADWNATTGDAAIQNKPSTMDPTSHGNSAHSSTFITSSDVHSNGNDPSSGEKAALAGTSGTPGAENKYVTNDDSRNTNARTPSSHGNEAHSSTYITAADAPAETVTTVGSLIAGATAKDTPIDNDRFGYSDSAASNILKYLSWGNIKTALLSWLDALNTGNSYAVHQVSHGFTVGKPLYLNGATFALAKADAVETAEVVGVVKAVSGDDDFVIGLPGCVVTGLTGLTAGSTYFLSAATAGALTATEPDTTLYYSKPVYLALTTTIALVGGMRGLKSAVLTTANIASATNYRYVTDAQLAVLNNTSGTNSGPETVGSIGALIVGATAKTTPIDADVVGFGDTEASNVLKKATWTNIKAFLKTYFDTLYIAVGAKAAASGVASLNASTKVVEDPANATSTATASKIPIADGSGKLDTWVTPGKNTVKVLQFTIDNGSSALAANMADAAFFRFPYTGTINSWSIIADASGSVAIDIWKHASGTVPTASDKITSTTGPSLSSAQMVTDSTSMSGWTTSVTAGDIFVFHVVSATTVKRVTVSLKITITGVTI